MAKRNVNENEPIYYTQGTFWTICYQSRKTTLLMIFLVCFRLGIIKISLRYTRFPLVAFHFISYVGELCIVTIQMVTM